MPEAWFCAPTTSCLLLCCRTLVTLAVHMASKALWRGYSKRLRPSERRQWCNKIACGLHVGAACLPAWCGQMPGVAAAAWAVAATQDSTTLDSMQQSTTASGSHNVWGILACRRRCWPTAKLLTSSTLSSLLTPCMASPVGVLRRWQCGSTAVTVQHCCQGAAAYWYRHSPAPPTCPHTLFACLPAHPPTLRPCPAAPCCCRRPLLLGQLPPGIPGL
jgi:hypothetical protein